MRRKLPLDPFDPATPCDQDIQVVKLGGVIVMFGLAVGGYLIASANFGEWEGWLISFAGAGIVVAATLFARKLIRSI